MRIKGERFQGLSEYIQSARRAFSQKPQDKMTHRSLNPPRLELAHFRAPKTQHDCRGEYPRIAMRDVHIILFPSRGLELNVPSVPDRPIIMPQLVQFFTENSGEV